MTSDDTKTKPHEADASGANGLSVAKPQSHATHDNHAESVANSDLEMVHANDLYEQAKALANRPEIADPATARLLIETANDAISAFGKTNQSKKLELRQWKAAAEESLPPETLWEVGERGQGLLLAKWFPRNRIVRRTIFYFAGTLVVVSAVVGGYRTFLKPASKPPENVNKHVPAAKPPDSITVNLPEGLTLRRAIIFLAQIESFTPDFKKNCASQFINTEVEGGPMTAASTVELIELLRLRLKNSQSPAMYSVLRKSEKGTYEISCS